MHPIRLSLFFFFCCFTASLLAQDWAPIHPDRTYHYKSEASVAFLDQTILVDSSYVDGSSAVYLLNRLTRPCDTCAIYGSIWVDQPTVIGDQVEIEPGGDYIFSGEKTIRIRPAAGLGESWTFSDNPQVEATVTAVSEQMILGETDSTKLISLSNGNELTLSKSFGIISVSAMPPYEEETYNLVGIEMPGAGIEVPGFSDYFDFAVGDVFQYRNVQQWLGDQNEELLKLTVLSKEVFADSIRYEARRVSRTRLTTNFGYPFDTIYMEDTIQWVFRQSEWAWTDAYHHQLVENTIDPNINGENTSVVTMDNLGGAIQKSVGSGDLMNGTYEPLPSDSSIYILSWLADIYVRDAEPGLGQTSYYLLIFEASESSDLIGYVKGGDTTGTVYADEELLTKVFSPLQALESGLAVFPNPTNGRCQVVWGNPVQESLEVFLLDGTGRLIDRKIAPSGSTSLSLSLEGYPAGIFQVVLVGESGIAQTKVVKR